MMKNELHPMNSIPAPLEVEQVVLRMNDGSEIVIAQDGRFRDDCIPTLYAGGMDAEGKHQIMLVIGRWLRVAMPAMAASTEAIEVEPSIIEKVN